VTKLDGPFAACCCRAGLFDRLEFCRPVRATDNKQEVIFGSRKRLSLYVDGLAFFQSNAVYLQYFVD
jgi:hypothetical protein